jgi:hypothetical protein
MSQTIHLDDLMTNEEAARLLGLKPNTLEIWRINGKGPAYLKLGDARQAPIRYQRSVLLAWAATRVRKSTSEYPMTAKPDAIPAPWLTRKARVSGSDGAS